MRVLLDLIRPTSGRAAVFRDRDDRRSGRDPSAGRLPARRVRSLRPAHRRPHDHLLRQPARRRRRRVRRRARRAPGPRPESALPRVLQGQQAEGRPDRRAPAQARPADPRRAHGRPRSARPADVLRAGPRGAPAGRTIFLSSHIIDEVDRTCDRVAIIREGRLVQVDRIEAIRRLAFHHVELTFHAPVATAVFDGIAGVQGVVGEGNIVTMRVSGPIGAVIAAAAGHGLVDVVSREPNLEDVFLAQYGEHPIAGDGGEATAGTAGTVTRLMIGDRRPKPGPDPAPGHVSRGSARSTARPSATAGARRSSSVAWPRCS